MKYHFIGIKGSGMSALAQVIHDLGHYVQGSDVTHHLFTQNKLEEKNILIKEFNEKNITKEFIIVVGNAFNEQHIEYKKAKELNLKIYKYYELLAELVKKYDSLAVSGCHGKTTTTALLGHVLNIIDSTNYLIGDGTGFANKTYERFVFEACEYKRVFLNYYPKDIIITNIELDHVDYYEDIEDVKSAYIDFLKNRENNAIVCGDDENIRNINIQDKVFYYGFDESNDCFAKNIELNSKSSDFEVFIKNEFVGKFSVPLYGKHMILNTLAVISYCYLKKLNINEVNDAIQTFKGAKRRFNQNVIKNIVTIDDYAHHPTEVKVTIESARQKYPDKEIVAVFLENTFSRTKMLYKDFAKALEKADYTYVTDILSDREKKENYKDVTPYLILDLLKNKEYLKIENIENLVNPNNFEIITPLLKHKDSVIIFMGCKEVYYLKEKFEKTIKEE